MLDVLILCNQRFGMSSIEFSDILSATVHQYSESDQKHFECVGWDGKHFPKSVNVPRLIAAVRQALGAQTLGAQTLGD